MTTLVVGSTGKTGRRVADRLRALGLDVREGARSSAISFDWTDRATWQPALAGVDSAYVTYYPDLAVPGSSADIAAFTDLAVESGLQRLVLLSGRGEDEARACEDIVLASRLEVTIVRATWFAQNFDESYFLGPILDGVVALPVDGVAEPFVDADDIADVAVAALTEEGHAGRVYEVTGPRLWTFADAIAEIAAATGRAIEFVPIGVDEFAAAMRAEGAPDDVVDLLVYLFATVLDGRNAHLTDGVREALGRPPRDFSDYVRAAAATGVWSK